MGRAPNTQVSESKKGERGGMKVCRKYSAATFGVVVVVVLIVAMSSVTGHAYGGIVANITGTEELMLAKQYGTCVAEVEPQLLWKCDRELANRISCFNRHYAEHSGYFQSTEFPSYATSLESDKKITFYDSVTGKPLFIAPIGRTMEAFLAESRAHGWPSFRDLEVVQSNVRVLPNGETVSIDGTHLGHNLPDGLGNRYCINLVCIAGNPPRKLKETMSL
jgi:peptide methionine sulfoxide reductase MsrB|eukprot:Stramenopile-MAST_4_protein_1954